MFATDPPPPPTLERIRFEEAARPLIKYMAEHQDPHAKAIVHSTGAELLNASCSLGEVLDYVMD